MAGKHMGGCLCGAVRYEATELRGGGMCHCRMCQKASGAPVVAFASAATAGFRWTKGKPQAYRSSAGAERLFCPSCGTQLAFHELAGTDRIALNTATLDHPEQAAPRYHIFTSTAQPWLKLADGLPSFPGDRPPNG